MNMGFMGCGSGGGMGSLSDEEIAMLRQSLARDAERDRAAEEPKKEAAEKAAAAPAPSAASPAA